ncbi:MAG TPA: hydroxyisourate hydrolase [Streptosporangiaceae bacterium]
MTTHVLDTARGQPAAGLRVRLERVTSGAGSGQAGEPVASGSTGPDGRLSDLGPAQLPGGTYRLIFDTGDYLVATAGHRFFPEVTVTFTIDEREPHYHVPLLLSPFGYATYRGS